MSNIKIYVAKSVYHIREEKSRKKLNLLKKEKGIRKPHTKVCGFLSFAVIIGARLQSVKSYDIFAI